MERYTRKIFALATAMAMLSAVFGMLASDNAQAAFIQPLSNSLLPGTFVAYDTAWNEAGTMAVVVGYDSHATLPQTNAYAYWPHNDTYTPIDNGGYNGQRLRAVDYFRQPVYDLPKVLVVNADYSYDGIVNFYADVLSAVHSLQGVHAELWQVWDYNGMVEVQGKPTAADMAPYDLVIWIPTRDMYGLGGADDALNSADTQQVAQYLDGGGNFFISNLAFSGYHDFGSSGYFTYDYLGVMNYDGWTNYEYGVEPVSSDPVYDGIGYGSQNWWNYGWSGEPGETDVLYTGMGTGCFRSYDGAMDEITGVRYDGGSFKTVYLGFPLETLDMTFARKLMQRTLDWIKPPTLGSPMSVTLNPAKDTSIYNENPNLSNGAGQYLVTGRTFDMYDRRALLQFDLSESIPKYSRIDSVSLTLHCTYDMSGSSNTVSLYAVNSDWGEAGSDATGDEISGAPAQSEDATWEYRFYSMDMWSPGGDVGSYLQDVPVGNSGMDYTWSSQYMKDHIEGWVADPSANYGFILIGEEWDSTKIKNFASRENPNEAQRPRLSIMYSELEPVGYQDVFWIAGDTTGTPPATCYKVVPFQGMELISMNQGLGHPSFYSMAVDDYGNPLCAGYNQPYMYYYNGTGWLQIPDPNGDLSFQLFDAMDFNPNDGRFYAVGMGGIWYSDPVPFSGSSRVYSFNWFLGNGDDMYSIAWNNMYDYGLVAEGHRLLKIWPYGHYGNGTIRYQSVYEDPGYSFKDISWDTDGWNEAAIVGSKGGNRAYWRYYHSNPQLLEGHIGASGLYYTCAFKPPSSPKWLFIPSGSGSVRANVEEKDQSGEITVYSEFPHIFTVDMWKQSNPARLSTLGTQVETDSTYTFFVEGNHTRAGSDLWSTDLTVYIQGWYDGNNIGFGSNPPDMTWTAIMYRTWQFNISYFPATGMAAMNYPLDPGMATPEFSIHSSWQDPVTYGSDGSRHRFYVNVTFGKQTAIAPGDGIWDTGNPWDRNSLNDGQTWDLKVLFYDTFVDEARNESFAEFGVQRYASISTSGNPSGSIPPGGSDILATPSLITYSSNTPYQLNVSIPHLYKDGNPASPDFIPATWVSVMNDQGDDDLTNSDISDWTAFSGPDDALCIWGLESGMYISPPGHGTVLAGPFYSDYTPAPGAFQPTPVLWQVVVPSIPEGVYRGTITITLWS